MNKDEIAKVHLKICVALEQVQEAMQKHEKELHILSEQEKTYNDALNVLETQLLAYAMIDETPKE